MRLKVLLVFISCLFHRLNALDIEKIDINVKREGSVITVTVPNSPDVTSLFFSSELADECTASYTFLETANDTNLLSYNQDIYTELKTNDMLRVIGVFEMKGQLKTIAYNYEVDANGLLKKLPIKEEDVCVPPPEPRNGNFTRSILFEENFDKAEWGTWSHALYSRQITDKEFTAFVKNEENSYIKDGKLYIHATPSNIRATRYKIAGCTSPQVKMCGPYRGVRDQPPIFSATLHNNFNIPIGSKVDIVAQMPIGDWLFPYLMLKPTDENVEDGYRNIIKIAYARGNRKLLNEADSDIGGTTLFGSAYIFDSLESRSEIMGSITHHLGKHFGEEFHTYSVIWLWNRIIFQVDGRTYATIRDKIVLEEINKSRSYNLVLALTAGGIMNFENVKDAPFKFSNAKTVISFSEMYNKSSWTQPSLVVDRVVVSKAREEDE